MDLFMKVPPKKKANASEDYLTSRRRKDGVLPLGRRQYVRRRLERARAEARNGTLDPPGRDAVRRRLRQRSLRGTRGDEISGRSKVRRGVHAGLVPRARRILEGRWHEVRRGVPGRSNLGSRARDVSRWHPRLPAQRGILPGLQIRPQEAMPGRGPEGPEGRADGEGAVRGIRWRRPRRQRGRRRGGLLCRLRSRDTPTSAYQKPYLHWKTEKNGHRSSSLLLTIMLDFKMLEGVEELEDTHAFVQLGYFGLC